MLLEGAVELGTTHSLESPKANMENDDLFGKPVSTKSGDTCSDWFEKNFYSSLQETHSQWDKAALKLQKVYKSFRTRRQLADCAVLAEQRWWKALDFAELKRSSISFFDIGKPETATSRWARARKRAAKVGKGLSKDMKARKLALQHWLEAIDPRHRYGHNLQFYYVKWLHCDSYQPFFYWLDVGDGKEVLSDRCSRTKLQQQCIKYLGPVERKRYEVVIENGRFFYKISGKPVQTARDAKWIFVLSTLKTLYVGEKNKGTFQHSSFLAGGATLSAGRLVAENGVLKAVWPHSGHYLPTKENFEELMSFLKENNVDLTDVKKNPDEEDDFTKINQDLFRDNPSEAMEPLNIETEIANTLSEDQHDLRNEDSNADSNNQQPLSKLSVRFGSKIAKIEIPKRVTLYDIFGELANGPRTQYYSPTAESDGYETAEESLINESEFMVSKSNMFAEKQDEDVENTIPKEKILKRIDSHKARKSYQLANQLSTKWTTGAGPRIGCMRDYPLEIRNLILEQQNLSPKTRTTAPSPRIPPLSRFSPRVAFPPPLGHAPGA